jgi:pentatricopeptide repeat protein
MKLMTDQQHPVSAYSWSILVDIHAKLGDFESCADIVKEMAHEGVPPPQAAYTSLLAACYRVCNDGRIPHKIRAIAGDIGWNHWQEMRIVGIEADAMAYGAIIRLCAARGQAERAINLLEEMHRFEVKPTSLCFSGALRAVARSHEIGVRFERGSSRKQLRRELFTAHHGKMARQIVIMAENAEVEQDESFVSALMLCSAAAGDSATAKAVYLASEVRKMDYLRTIGPNSIFKPLQGERGDYPELELGANIVESGDSEYEAGSSGRSLISPDGSSTKVVVTHQSRKNDHLKSFGEREYGKDTRALSALLKSCGQAMGPNNLGTMWEGKSNRGYLCENSLRLITTRWEPSYTKSSIPDELSSKVGISSLRRYDENDRDEPRKNGSARKKFRGLYLDDDAEDLIDDYATAYNNDQHDRDDDDSDLFGRRRAKGLTEDGNEEGPDRYVGGKVRYRTRAAVPRHFFARCHG